MAAAARNLRRALPVVFLLVAACGGRDELLDSPADASTPDVDAAAPDVDASVPDVDASAPDSGDGATDASVDVSDAGWDVDVDPDADADAGADAESDACVGCVCVPGETAECYGGPDSTAGVGICTVGQRTCTEAGQWSECDGEVLPAQEDCATPLDDDCDGEVNEEPSCVCTPGATASCYGGAPQTNGVGVCKSGTQTCDPSGTGWGPCEGQVVPKMEDCPSLDDEDCDGQVNEEGLNCVCKPGSQTICYSGPPGTDRVGACYPGYAICAADGMSYGPCIGEVVPSPEDCAGNSQDEDCDGLVNEEGPSCICVPDEFSGSCYTGPPGTSGVGICKPGQLFCEGSGLEFDDNCYDEVLPVLENCAAPEDEDCDGTAAPPCVTTPWTKTLPLVSTIRIATHDAGVWLAGTAKQPTDFGGGTLPSGSLEDAWIARFDSAGNHVFSRRYPGAGTVGTVDVAVGPNGEAVLVGSCFGATPFDAVSFDCKSGKAFVVELDASGNLVWAKTFGDDAAHHAASGVDVDALGNVIVVGRHFATIDFGGGPLTTTEVGSTFLAKLDSNGGHVFSKSFAHSKSGSTWSADVAALSGGDIIVAGAVVGSIDLGGGVLGSLHPTLTYVARFSSQGAHVWSKGWMHAALERMRVTSADAIVLSGYHSGTMIFGATPLPGPGRFIGDLTPAGGSTWSANVAVTVASNKFDMRALAVRAGSPVIIGGDGFSADFGYGKLTEGYLVGVDFAGTPLWQYADQRVVWDAAYDAQGHLYAAGQDFLWKLQP